MPEKLPRKRVAGTGSYSLSVPDAQTALILGAAHVTHGAARAAGDVAATTVNSAGQVLQASIRTFGECFSSFMIYMQEREITKQVIIHEMAETRRVEIWSETVIAEAQERTEQVKISASLVLAAIHDRAQERSAKLEVIRGFMDSYKEWNAMLTKALASRADRMPMNERELLQQHIGSLLQRAREMENSITAIALSL
jgi:hypothetical protein